MVKKVELSVKSDIHNYPKPSVTVDLVVFTVKNDNLNVLLVKRKADLKREEWALPGGFVKLNESLENAARRELKEETGVEDVYFEQLYTFGDPDRDSRGRVITIAYFSLIDYTKIKLQSTNDVVDAKWFSMYSLPPLAFDHSKILNYALTRLRYKLEYTTVGFQLLPQKFTLTELQKLYEVILDKKLDKRNFRKKIDSLKLVEPTKETKMEGIHRPAKLYKFKSKKFLLERDVV
ncbi:NUDIX hydrolase [Candidatus Woesearchaeota archaeon CG10_big_fil_rev_8_21_14_0_10_30_7]|nr:MAG: NUDIX hydrolase [Candidatus Woesearchaeota archaeon CG10_big_fil_rev_8_21_14_0_10_30_7]